MKCTYLSGFTVAVALVVGNCALAEDPETQELLAMIRGIEFITQNSSLEYAGQPLPRVAIVTENELQLRLRAAEEEHSFGRVSALYDRDANQIFLADANAIPGPGLFHELVHFLQNINNRDDMFLSRRVCLEAEAYELQAIWQTEQGIDPASRPEYGLVTTLYGVCNDADFSWIDRN